MEPSGTQRKVDAPSFAYNVSRWMFGLTLIAALGQAGCHSTGEAHEKESAYETSNPIRKDTSVDRDFVCQIRSIQHIEIRALEDGYLQKIFVDEGQSIKQGTRMFQIMPVLYQAEAEKAEAEAQFAEVEYQNTKKLADSNVVSPAELKLNKAKLAKANAELTLAKARLGFTDIRAPFDGIVGRFQARLGSLLDEGDLLTTLADNSRMWVYFNVAEAEYLRLKQQAGSKGIPVKLRMANGQFFDQPGVVETIESDFNNANGNIAFRAGFPNPKGLLRHGETGTIVLTEELKDALLIPQKATYSVMANKYVYVVDDKNVLHARPITVRAELPNLFAIASGLTVKDRILIDGLRKVKDGDTIKQEYKDPKEVLEHLQVPAE